MTDLLIAFVIPIIVIILSIVLESIIRNPYKVVTITFVATMIAAISLGGSFFYLSLAWLYTLLSFLVTLIIRCYIMNCRTNLNINNNRIEDKIYNYNYDINKKYLQSYGNNFEPNQYRDLSENNNYYTESRNFGYYNDYEDGNFSKSNRYCCRCRR